MGRFIAGLFVLCAVTIAVLAVVYNQIDEPLSADQSSVATPTGTRAVPTLQFVVAVTRHGNRAPLFSYPKSPYQHNDTKVWPYGAGELTQMGRIQMYNLGMKFRSLYNGFLDEIYEPQEFQAFSTLKRRTLQSSEVLLAGLFPPKGFQVWNKHLLWQPIPIFPTLWDHEEIVPSFSPNLCPRYRKAQTEAADELHHEIDPELNKLVEYAIPYLGFDSSKNISRTIILYYIWDSLKYLPKEGLALPLWSKNVFPEPITSLFGKFIQSYTIGSDTQIRYLEGELFKDIVERIQARGNNRDSASHMIYYSGHDHTLLGLKAILGLQNKGSSIVNPGSAIILELHKDPSGGQLYMKVLYIDGDSSNLEPEEMTMPECPFPCDFHQLLEITEKYYNITNWKEECQLN